MRGEVAVTCPPNPSNIVTEFNGCPPQKFNPRSCSLWSTKIPSGARRPPFLGDIRGANDGSGAPSLNANDESRSLRPSASAGRHVSRAGPGVCAVPDHSAREASVIDPTETTFLWASFHAWHDVRNGIPRPVSGFVSLGERMDRCDGGMGALLAAIAWTRYRNPGQQPLPPQE